eukprot:TRINITY_DN2269_c0_g1_i1.p1 TRINITY_DN2269_c0_g1~~TRINITY_DN2269_c0_g1_i1.p1  ORF type:complete len:710 (-),score=86.95 TRINITY_DN2269_c0_g1_i1:6404-8533(-)
MKNLIEVINKMQEIFAKVNLPLAFDLPVIAVVGAQSTGKSSVLETIVGKDFLPRGSGIVTRRPLILQLRHITDSKDYAIFSHKPDVIYEDFDEVRSEIEADTDRIAGKNKGISSQPIILKVFSKEVLDLTLVDLPGLTKVPVKDQPHNIEEILRGIVLDVVKRENCLILAVTAGNTDLANSDAIKLAREVDPKGDRTIGVITKLDLLDKGTDAMEILEGHLYPLKLGYIGVVCRSQKDINEGKSMREALKSEQEFFNRHPTYSKIQERCGIVYLARRLNKLLMGHILHCIPTLKNNITAMLQARLVELRTYGIDLVSENKGNLGALLLYMISKFVEYYQSTIEGNFVQDSTKELRGGARIHYVFHKVFAEAIKGIKALDGLTDEDIRTAIMNAKSLHPSLFIPEAAFENLIRQQIIKLLDPSLQCMQLVHEELRRIVTHPDIPELMRFNKLMQRISEIMTEVLYQCVSPTEDMIRNLIKIEDSYINVNHPDVLSATGAILGMMQYDKSDDPAEQERIHKEIIKREEESREEARKKNELAKQEQRRKEGGGLFSYLFGGKKSPKEEAKKEGQPDPSTGDVLNGGRMKGQFPEISAGYMKSLPENMRADNPPTSREILETGIIKRLLKSYFKVVRKNIADLIPKAIMAFLVNKSKAIAQNELVGTLYSERDIETLMAENPAILEKRTECRKMVDALQEALKVLHEIAYSEL